MQHIYVVVKCVKYHFYVFFLGSLLLKYIYFSLGEYHTAGQTQVFSLLGFEAVLKPSVNVPTCVAPWNGSGTHLNFNISIIADGNSSDNAPVRMTKVQIGT